MGDSASIWPLALLDERVFSPDPESELWLSPPDFELPYKSTPLK